MALADIEDQVGVAEMTQHLLEMSSMLIAQLGEHRHVVDEDSDKVQAVQEYGYDSLEMQRQRPQAERCTPNLVLNSAPSGSRLVATVDRNRKTMARLPEIQDREHLGSGDRLENVADVRKQRRTAGQQRVERAEIVANAKIRLGVRGILRDQEERRVECRGRSTSP
jgi:hypothetical protein